MSEGWSREEVEATTADYLHMLMLELAGQVYNKSDHRRALQKKLQNRSEAAIERKHQNISAVLIELGCPYINGYKPLGNYQALLGEVVADQINATPSFDKAAVAASEMPAASPLVGNIVDVMVDAPVFVHSTKEAEAPAYFSNRAPIKRDYIGREARNISLGNAGEEFAVAFEHARLHAAGQKKLADRVEHVSSTKGDGLGYDILSYDETGKERFIEVKTTAFGKETPFFISKNEVEFSKANEGYFHLYRLFEFRKAPRMFDLRGAVTKNCLLDPISFAGRFS